MTELAEPAERAEPAAAALAAPVPDRVAAEATAVDAGETDLRPAVAEVIRSGGLHLGPTGVAEQARVLAGLAQECMSTAFSFWGHRMALEYLDRFGSSAHRELREDLAQGNRPGVSAMARAFRRYAEQAAGAEVSGLGVRASAEASELVLEGFLPYATNLHPDAVLVLGVDLDDASAKVANAANSANPTTAPTARTVGAQVANSGATTTAHRQAPHSGAAIVVVELSTPGIEVSPAKDLLALGSTRSGSLHFDGARIPAAAVLPAPFEEVVGGTRATFLTLQSAFCLGHAHGSLAGLSPAGTAFEAEAADLTGQVADLTQHLLDLAASAYEPGTDISAYLRLRLEVMQLATESAHLALCLTGGRGYTRTHPVSRRLREAAFLPVQAPTKGQLLWELQSLNSPA